MLSRQELALELSWYQRRRYAGRFIAVLFDAESPQIVSSGNSYTNCRHSLRKRVMGQPDLRRDIRIFYVEKRGSYFRGLFLAFLSFLIFQLVTCEALVAEIHVEQKIVAFLLFNLLVIAVFLASVTIITPVLKSRMAFGFLGSALKNQERQLGWEVSMGGVSGFVFLASLLVPVWLWVETGLTLDSSVVVGGVLFLLLLLQIRFSVSEEKTLRTLHNYFIDQITLEDRLSYEEIVDYLAEIPELKAKGFTEEDRATIMATLDATLGIPFSLTKVISFHILFRDLAINFGFILFSFVVGYSLFVTGVVTDLIGARIFGSLLSAGFLLIYAMVKRSTSESFSHTFVKTHPGFSLRPGGVDRVYVRFFPAEVEKMKQEAVLTVLTQSVALTAVLGVALCTYGVILFGLVVLGVSSELLYNLSALVLLGGIFLLVFFIVRVARNGTNKWVSTVEAQVTEMDHQVERKMGLSPNEIIQYLEDARTTYDTVFKADRSGPDDPVS